MVAINIGTRTVIALVENKAGVLARPELETMQFVVKGVTSEFPVK